MAAPASPTKATIRYLTGPRTHPWWNSIDVYTPSELREGRPVLLFVGGGGWQGVDHVNSHSRFAREVVELGYVAVVVRHRPAALDVGGCLGLVCLPLLACMLAITQASPWLFALLLLLVGALIVGLNAVRGAVPLPDVVHDCAAAIAFVYHELDCSGLGGDRDRLVLCGNSSGGHLLMLVALGALQPHELSGAAQSDAS